MVIIIMNFRSGFGFFKQAARMFAAPPITKVAYPKSLQRVVNKALIK